jgi:tetratricopeptide (TPR) repeat protein
MYGHRAFLAPAAILAALSAFAARPAQTETGRVLAEATLRRIDGGAAPLVDRASGATALIFFKPGQERSLETLRLMARCQPMLAGRPVRWVGIVPGDTDPAEARAAVEASGAPLAVLVDEGDALYGKLGMRMHPAVGVVDRARRLVAFEPFHQTDYCGIVMARLRRALGEISDEEVARALAPAESALPGADPAGVARRHLSFARKLLEARAYAQAHESTRKALTIAPLPAAWTLEGRIFAAEGRCADAVAAFDAALRMDPRDADAVAGKQGCGR